MAAGKLILAALAGAAIATSMANTDYLIVDEIKRTLPLYNKHHSYVEAACQSDDDMCKWKDVFDDFDTRLGDVVSQLSAYELCAIQNHSQWNPECLGHLKSSKNAR